MDLNTADTDLTLSDGNRKVTDVEKEQSYPDHLDRFTVRQVLSVEELTGRCYFEVEWGGTEIRIAAAYKDSERDCVSSRVQKNRVYLDHSAGALSFYSVQGETMSSSTKSTLSSLDLFTLESGFGSSPLRISLNWNKLLNSHSRGFLVPIFWTKLAQQDPSFTDRKRMERCCLESTLGAQDLNGRLCRRSTSLWYELMGVISSVRWGPRRDTHS
ncbi:hypothetical protein WMY93_026251 [Mugilogobius chulae]|uniref:SPRY-associated domain-containing protein n=1 Tax=Mugilogobius chulae TaxID=88201 RepID=A0AAW0N2N4_9GOBI